MNNIFQLAIFIFIIKLCQSCSNVPPSKSEVRFEKIEIPPANPQRKADTGWKPFRIHFEFNNNIKNFATVKKLTNRAGEYFKNTLQVKPFGVPLSFEGSCTIPKLCDITVPSSHIKGCGPGVDADFVMYVTVVNDGPCMDQGGYRSDTVAYAHHCVQAESNKRPIAGRMNICPRSFELREDKIYYTIRHEILHALAFSSSLYEYFNAGNDAQGDAQFPPQLPKEAAKQVRRFKRKWKAVNPSLEKEVFLFITPKVVEAVRSHFGCDTLEGGELEDQGGNGTALQHWEKRLFGPEAMTGVSTTEAAPISNMTLAFLEDSGWYLPDYSKAEPLHYGKNKGCDFVTKSCKEYMDTKMNAGQSTEPYCYPKTLPQDNSFPIRCNNELTSLSTCKLDEYTDQLEEKFRYFDVPIGSIKTIQNAGGLELADFCTVPREFEWKSDDEGKDSRCTEPNNDKEDFLQIYSNESRCFTFNNTWMKWADCNRKYSMHSTFAGCYKHKCTDGKLWILAQKDDNWMKCNSEGQIIPISRKSAKGDWWQGTIICPACSELCPNCSPDAITKEKIGDDPLSNPLNCKDIPGVINGYKEDIKNLFSTAIRPACFYLVIVLFFFWTL